MTNQLIGFAVLGLRIAQAKVVCRDEHQIRVAAISGWISRCAATWESIKNTSNVPTTISAGVDAAMIEASQQAGMLPSYDQYDLSAGVDLIAEFLRSVELSLRAYMEGPHAENSALDAFELGCLLAGLDDEDLEHWLSGDDRWYEERTRVEELLQKTGMARDDVLGEPADEESFDVELPWMQSAIWPRHEAGLVNRWHTESDAEGTDESEQAAQATDEPESDAGGFGRSS